MTETTSISSDVDPVVPEGRLARDLRGAAALVLAGVAVRVVLCGLGGHDVAAAMAEVMDLVEVVPIRTEQDTADQYTVIVGPLRP